MMPSRIPHVIAWSALLLVLLLAAVLRIYHIDLLSLWIDEGFTWNLTQYHDPVQVLRQDVHPPLYFVAMDAWVALTGTSRLAMRYFSVLPGMLSVAVVYGLAHEIQRQRGWSTGGTVPLLAALLMALADAEIFLAQEARSYTWHVLFVCLSMWGFLKWLRLHQKRWLFLWGISTTALVYTFYPGAFIGIVQGIYVLFFLKPASNTDTSRSFWRRYLNRKRLLALGVLVGAALVLMPWLLLTLPEQSGNLSYAEWIQRDAFGFWAEDFSTRYLTEQSTLIPGLMLLGLLTIRYRHGTEYTGVSVRPVAPVMLLLLWLTVPLLLTFAINEAIPFYQPRRVSQIVPAIVLLTAFGLGNLPRFGRWFLVVVLLVYGLTHVDFWRFKQPWQQMAEATAPYIAPGTPVFFELGGDDYAPRYHYGQTLPASDDYLFDPTRTLQPGISELIGLTTWRHLEPAVYEAGLPPLLDSLNHLWLFYWSSDTGALSWLETFGFERTATFTVDFNPDVAFYRYDRLPEAPQAQYPNGLALRDVLLHPQTLFVELFWSTDAPLETNYTVSALLLDNDGQNEGQPLAQLDSQPFLNQRPMTGWQPGDTVYDPRHLRLLDGIETLPPGTYSVGVVVYHQTANGFERLQTTGGDDLHIAGQMTISPGMPVIPYPSAWVPALP
jgi:4-amino-4-deoxy-L-arabinose transferase-like glycosyltransferase